MTHFFLSLLPFALHLADVLTPYLPLIVTVGVTTGIIALLVNVANTIRHW